MTPLQFAKEYCANYQRDGSCAGLGIRDDLSTFVFGAKPDCCLIRKEACAYFAQNVMPMGIEPCNAANVIRLREKEEAERLYSQMDATYSLRTSRGTSRPPKNAPASP